MILTKHRSTFGYIQYVQYIELTLSLSISKNGGFLSTVSYVLISRGNGSKNDFMLLLSILFTDLFLQTWIAVMPG